MREEPAARTAAGWRAVGLQLCALLPRPPAAAPITVGATSCSSFNQDDVAGCFEYYAGLAEQLDGRQGEAVALPMEEFRCELRREPFTAPVGLITPWNYPRERPGAAGFLGPGWRAAAAVACAWRCRKGAGRETVPWGQRACMLWPAQAGG